MQDEPTWLGIHSSACRIVSYLLPCCASQMASLHSSPEICHHLPCRPSLCICLLVCLNVARTLCPLACPPVYPLACPPVCLLACPHVCLPAFPCPDLCNRSLLFLCYLDSFLPCLHAFPDLRPVCPSYFQNLRFLLFFVFDVEIHFHEGSDFWNEKIKHKQCMQEQ